jgi:dolichyl-phosphate beta-glucosyltransferase
MPPIPVSIVIPAYNEERRVPRTLERIHAYVLGRQTDPRALRNFVVTEIIVVDDGSTDNTANVVSSCRSWLPELRLVSNGVNRGKGFSVRRGVLDANGSVALFTDADLSAPIEEMESLLRGLSCADVAIGSRALNRHLIEIRQSRLRECAGIVFNKLVNVFTGTGFRDTQCGFKAFSLPRTKIIFEQQQINGFGFDPEILFLAKLHGFKSVEIPVRWAHDPATKVRVFRDSMKMLLDLLRIRWYWALGRYSIKKSPVLDSR